jgi:protein-S-isoprenylcysteine O-methyltransferase Ste14
VEQPVDQRLAAARPASAVGWPVCVLGAVVIAIGLILAVRSDANPTNAALAVMLAGLCPALALDGAPRLMRVWRDNGWRFERERVLVKIVGTIVAFILMGGAVAIFPFFHRDEFIALAVAAPTWGLLILIAAIAYVAFADGLLREPFDGLYALGALALGRPSNRAALINFLQTQIIKLFFFPLMLLYCASDIAFFREAAAPSQPFQSMGDFEWFNRLLFTGDVALSGMGYLATLRLFDWEVRETEPTLRGWVVCLVCYEPFFPAIERAFLAYHSSEQGAGIPSDSLAHAPWIVAMLAFNAIYLSATVAFGPLFSNLTRRAVITSGPYRYTKHPAYIAKNIGWWLYSTPYFLGGSLVSVLRGVVMLAGVSMIYFARARCEERTLLHDPVYGAYSAYIAEHGILARLRRALRLSSKYDESVE